MIVISQCPYRISLLGGSSDLDWYTKRGNEGLVLGYSLNKSSTVVVNRPNPGLNAGVLNYSTREYYSSIHDIAHPMIKKAMQYLDFDDKIEMSSFGFATGGAGLGGSSSFLNALLLSLMRLKLVPVTVSQVVERSTDIELSINPHMGRQDQQLCAYPGFNAFTFKDHVATKRVILGHDLTYYLNRQVKDLYLISSRYARSSSNSLNQLSIDYDFAEHKIKTLAAIAAEFIDSSSESYSDFKDRFAYAIKKSMEIKSKLSGVFTSDLNKLYSQIEQLPINWIRLLGAGGGGYFLVSSRLPELELNHELSRMGLEPAIKADVSHHGLVSQSF